MNLKGKVGIILHKFFDSFPTAWKGISIGTIIDSKIVDNNYPTLTNKRCNRFQRNFSG